MTHNSEFFYKYFSVVLPILSPPTHVNIFFGIYALTNDSYHAAKIVYFSQIKNGEIALYLPIN